MLSFHQSLQGAWQSRKRGRPAQQAPRLPRRLLLESLEERNLLAPTMMHPDLDVRTVVTGLDRPTMMAFLGNDDFLILEKDTGRVQRVVEGAVHSTVLDLPVNFYGQRGLLGIALHPNFARNHQAYLSWHESVTGADSGLASTAPLMGGRVDRFVWTGSTLQFDQTILRLRSFQFDEVSDPLLWGRHHGGPLAFGPDGKLYVIVGDSGRRGQMQNLPNGPYGPGLPDDQFGGPVPDNAHLSSVILRLNDNGSAPRDNPFYQYGRRLGGEVGANLQKIYSYGIKNSFGLAIDPWTGNVWNSETGDDAFTELNRVEPGQNSGWIQVAGPVSRIAEFKAIETGAIFPQYAGLGQLRYAPERIADSPEEALSRLHVLPGSHYRDPEFSWKFEIPAAGIGFVASSALGKEFEGNLFTGGAIPTTVGGHLFRFRLGADRAGFVFDDEVLQDKVADNLDKYDITESESLLIGRDFSALTHILTGPNGNVYAVSVGNGEVYEIFRRTAAPGRGLSGLAVSLAGLVTPAALWRIAVPDLPVTVLTRATPSPTELAARLPANAAQVDQLFAASAESGQDSLWAQTRPDGWDWTGGPWGCESTTVPPGA